MLTIGDSVPALVGSTASNASQVLAAPPGGSVVVYFYPKDNTTGCTHEAQDFAALHDAFVRHGALILGVSRDTARSHAGFIAKYSLPFQLIADVDESWCRAFGVIQEKVLYGRRYQGVVRSTFLIDDQNVVRGEWRNIKVAGHAQRVLDAVVAARA